MKSKLYAEPELVNCIGFAVVRNVSQAFKNRSVAVQLSSGLSATKRNRKHLIGYRRRK